MTGERYPRMPYADRSALAARLVVPSIADTERCAVVAQLLGQIEHLLEENRRQAEIIQRMRDEIAVLKGAKAKSKFKHAAHRERICPLRAGLARHSGALWFIIGPVMTV
jgi:hypothetical protein